MQVEDLRKWEGPAFACIISTLCALVFQKVDVFAGVCYWLGFTFLCGLYIDPLQYTWKELLSYSAIPAAWLVTAWVVIPTFGIILGGHGANPGEIAFFHELLVLGPLTFTFTTLAISLWALSTPNSGVLRRQARAPCNNRENLQGIGLIVSLLLTAIVYLKNIGSH